MIRTLQSTLLPFLLLLVSDCDGFLPIAQESGRFTLTQMEAATAMPVDAPIMMEKASPKIGVLLLNLGGPETGDDVEGPISYGMLNCLLNAHHLSHSLYSSLCRISV